MEMFEATAIKKLKVLSGLIETYRQHLMERKETINVDRIMERIEYLEPMMTDIYMKSDKKLEAERCQKLKLISIKIKEQRNNNEPQDLANVKKTAQYENLFHNEALKANQIKSNKSLAQTINLNNQSIANKSLCTNFGLRVKQFRRRSQEKEMMMKKHVALISPAVQKVTHRGKSKGHLKSAKKIAVKPFEKFKLDDFFDQLDENMFSEIATVEE